MISNELYLSTLFRNADRMVLHARTAANVSENEDLDGDPLFRRIGHILGWKEKNQNSKSSRQAEGDVDEGVEHGGRPLDEGQLENLRWLL